MRGGPPSCQILPLMPSITFMALESDMPAGPGPPQVEVIPLGRVSSSPPRWWRPTCKPSWPWTPWWPLPARTGRGPMVARGQYDASLILRELAVPRRAPAPGALGQGPVPAFLTYVLGESQLGGRAAVMSLHRLSQGEGGGRAQRHLMLERAAKVGLPRDGPCAGPGALPHRRLPDALLRRPGQPGSPESGLLPGLPAGAGPLRLEMAKRARPVGERGPPEPTGTP